MASFVQVLEDERLVKADTEKAAELAAAEAAEVQLFPLLRSTPKLSSCASHGLKEAPG